jgi:peptidyl-prolyl cis-trans isomerase C
LVTVNGAPITGETFGLYISERMRTMPAGSKPTPQMQGMVINELINLLLLAQVAHDTQLDSRPDVATALELQRNEMLSRLVLQEQAQKFTPGEEDLKKAYEKKYATPEQEYKAAHILVKTEEEATQILARLNQGDDFALLAKEHSMDANAKQGGDLGWFKASQMVKPFGDALAAMEIGTTSDAPVQTKFGWHLIKLEDKRATTPPTFTAVRQTLLMEAKRQALSAYVNQLRTQAVIKPNEALAKQVEPATPAAN